MRLKVLTLCLVVALTGTAVARSNSQQLPSGTVAHGTLTNDKLRSDAMVGVRQVMSGRGCAAIVNVTPYVLTQPVGKPGNRVWRERWHVNCGGKATPVIMLFKESGLGADWTVE